MPPPNPKELEQKGWTRRFNIELSRAPEHVETYESLGYEVILVPTQLAETENACDACYISDVTEIVTIYTKLKEKK